MFAARPVTLLAVLLAALYAAPANAVFYSYSDSFVPNGRAGQGTVDVSLTYDDQTNLFGFGLTLDATMNPVPEERDMFWLALSDDGAHPDGDDFVFWFGRDFTWVNRYTAFNDWTYFDTGLDIDHSGGRSTYSAALDVSALLDGVDSAALFGESVGLWLYADYGVGARRYRWGLLADVYYGETVAQVPEPTTPSLMLMVVLILIVRLAAYARRAPTTVGLPVTG